MKRILNNCTGLTAGRPLSAHYRCAVASWMKSKGMWRSIRQMKQVIRRNQRFEGEHFQTVLVRGRRLSMPRKDKAPSLWGLCQQSEAA